MVDKRMRNVLYAVIAIICVIALLAGVYGLLLQPEVETGGGSGSGNTTLAENIQENLRQVFLSYFTNQTIGLQNEDAVTLKFYADQPLVAQLLNYTSENDSNISSSVMSMNVNIPYINLQGEYATSTVIGDIETRYYEVAAQYYQHGVVLSSQQNTNTSTQQSQTTTNAQEQTQAQSQSNVQEQGQAQGQDQIQGQEQSQTQTQNQEQVQTQGQAQGQDQIQGQEQSQTQAQNQEQGQTQAQEIQAQSAMTTGTQDGVSSSDSSVTSVTGVYNYEVSYIAYVNNNILSLAITSTAKEPGKEQRRILSTYNVDITTGNQVTIQDLLTRRGITTATANNIIMERIQAIEQNDQIIKSQGYSAYSRNLDDAQYYNVENAENYMLGPNGEIYIVYNYGNNEDSYTMTFDVIKLGE